MCRYASTAISLVIACGKPSEPPREEPKPRPPPMVVDAAIDAMPIDAVPIDAMLAAPTIDQPGSAYVMAHGLFRLDESGKVFALDTKDALFHDLAVDGQGKVWVYEADLAREVFTLVTYDGRKRTSSKKVSYLTAIAPAAAGGLWMIDERSLISPSSARFVLPKELDGEPIDWSSGDADMLDDTPHVWIGAMHGLYRFAPATKTWERMRSGIHLDGLVRADTGMIWTIERDPSRIAGFDGTKWFEIAAPKEHEIDSIVAGHDGLAYAVVTRKNDHQWETARIAVFDATGWRVDPLGPERGMDALFAVDGAGRIWARQQRGIVVLASDGTPLDDLPIAKIPGLLGNLVIDVAVVGDGPRTLPPVQPYATGTLRGRVVDEAGKPKRLEIEICAGGCGDERPQLKKLLVTDEEGRFQIDEIVITDYQTAHVPGETAHAGLSHTFVQRGRGVDCCLQMKPGKTLDLGTITYKPAM
jgi:streptogramin lyase